MANRLTHTEACKLVEDALERVAKTLAYIRCKLEQKPTDKPVQLSLFAQNALDEADLLCNVNYYGAYLKGAQAMYRALENNFYLDYQNKEDWLTSKAQLKAHMESSRNLEWLLHGLPQGIEIYTSFERNKKGKVIGAKSKFVKKEVEYKEV